MTRLSFAKLAARGSLLVNDGYRTKTTELGATGFPILRVAEIDAGIVVPSYADHVRIEFRSKIGYKLSRAGDVLLTTKGTVGRRAIMPALDVQLAYSPQLCFFRVLDDSIDSRWLYYWLGGTEFWSQAAGVSQQTDMAPYVSLRDLRAVEIELPPIEEQGGIAATLGALDDKIESNRSGQHLILDLARAIYLAACGDGGRQVPLSDVAEFHNRRRIPLASREREQRVGPFPYYGATGVFGYVDDFLFNEVLVLVGEDGSVVNPDGAPVTQYIWGRAWINNHAHPLTGKGISNELLLLALRESDVRSIVTGAVQPKISMGNLKRLTLVLPLKRAIESLVVQLDDLFATYRHLADETTSLVEVRDALLPELLSGRIRVPEAHETVADTAASV